jgi:hypothetical protein
MKLPPKKILVATLIALVACAAIPVLLAPALGAEGGAHSLVEAAKTAQNDGRKIAADLIGLGFAIASIVLAFRRDFKEAVGVFAIGIVALVLSTSTGVEVLRATVKTLFG